jgi:hypothetical protein
MNQMVLKFSLLLSLLSFFFSFSFLKKKGSLILMFFTNPKLGEGYLQNQIQEKSWTKQKAL